MGLDKRVEDQKGEVLSTAGRRPEGGQKRKEICGSVFVSKVPKGEVTDRLA